MQLFLEEGGDVTILQQSAVVTSKKLVPVHYKINQMFEVLEARLGLLKRGTGVGSQLSYEQSTYYGYYYISSEKW